MKVLVPFPALNVPETMDLTVYDGGTPPVGSSEAEVYVLPLTFDPEPLELIARLPRLRHLLTLTAGYEHLLDRVPPGVILSGTGDLHAASVSELAATLTLASTIGLPSYLRAQTAHTWVHAARKSLADSGVLVVGAGAIGRAIQQRLEAFECSVTCIGRSTSPNTADLPELLTENDVVILAVPLTDDTRGMVDASFLASMRDGALLVNVARGAVVDTDALLKEVQVGRIRAALDVVDPEPLPSDHELWDCEGVTITPHVGGRSTAFRPRAERHVERQLARIAAGLEPDFIIAT
jgi:phosphoglycerate dehydrogenase-like enzyme